MLSVVSKPQIKAAISRTTNNSNTAIMINILYSLSAIDLPIAIIMANVTIMKRKQKVFCEKS
jgi:hypothetical protein